MYSYWGEPCCSECEERWGTKTPLLHHTLWYISLPSCAHLGERPSCLLYRLSQGSVGSTKRGKREITRESWRQPRSARGEWWERAQSDCRAERKKVIARDWGRGRTATHATQPTQGFLPSHVPFSRKQSHLMQGYPRKSWILDSKLTPVTGLRILIIVSVIQFWPLSLCHAFAWQRERGYWLDYR